MSHRNVPALPFAFEKQNGRRILCFGGRTISQISDGSPLHILPGAVSVPLDKAHRTFSCGQLSREPLTGIEVAAGAAAEKGRAAPDLQSRQERLGGGGWRKLRAGGGGARGLAIITGSGAVFESYLPFSAICLCGVPGVRYGTGESGYLTPGGKTLSVTLFSVTSRAELLGA